MREALTREEVKRAVERTGEGPVPVMMAKWWGRDCGKYALGKCGGGSG